jgi:hypothetical protein
MSQDEYYIEFGRFIYWYARVEAVAHALFEFCIGASKEEARAISGGLRFGDIRNITKRLAKVRKLDIGLQTEIDQLFSQIGEISKLRDTLVHRGAEVVAGVIWSTNLATSKSDEDIEILKLNLSDITAAKTDCLRIFARIDRILQPDFYQHREAMEWLAQPWLYKHRSAETPNRPPKRPANTRSRKR